MKHILAILISLAAAVGASGCATQADLQTEQRAREDMRRQFADNKVAIDEVRREVESVRGDIEEVRNRLDRVAKDRVTSTPQMKLLEDRLAALERQVRLMQGSAPPPIGSVVPLPGAPNEDPLIVEQGTPTPPTPPPSGAATAPENGGVDLALSKESLEAREEYKSALKAMREQDYNKAIQQFRNFQRQNPASAMADDAQYWVGESYFVQKDYNRAILEFNDVLKYRRGDKVPAALLRQAQAFVEIGDTIDARLILQKLVNDHPNSEEAAAAREKLPTLGR